ncbi:hypothetical protein MANES_13G063066v8 [Manihot esculenta]|uniref:Uncharacterized protein n=1 Tax=Manihot esculenta TaxID=3983 RepID=A0A2C9UPP8_MANES|nr:hypothetical protein MANES_13G063066v8 [Manihot esculenta]
MVYLDMWEAMKTIQANHMMYMGENIRPNFTDVDTYYGEYDYSMTMFNNGVKLEYDKIQDIFLAIDPSTSRFEGKIPKIIGNLKGLNLLNLSNNLLKGHIPPSLACLGSLEGLDLSKNKLSRKIPPELAQLTFLAFFNVSYNELEGPIPQGKQFDTFQSNQYEGNLGLCRAPLTKKCEDFGDSPPFFPTSDYESIALECKPSDLRRCTYYQTKSSFNSSIQRCHDDESLALLQFKNSFNISSSCSYSKLESWKLNQGVRSGESCSWDGVECDEKTNHVVSLDLSESCIYGSINSNSTLFRLVHLQTLNLGSNNFIHPQISSEIGQLSRLTHLDLSFSGFSGEIPAEISNLSSLVSLDLSCNLDFISYDGLLKLRQASFRGLVQNMTNLKELDLECVDISSTVLANLSSLESLHLCGCELHGEFPASELSPLICNLYSLEILDLSFNNLSRQLPHCLSNFSDLSVLDLRRNNFHGIIPAAWRDDCKLRMISISYNQLQGQVPKSLANCSSLQLVDFGLASCNLTHFPNFLQNQHGLEYLDLSSNSLQAQIPSWMCSISTNSMDFLNLSHNLLTGRQLPHCLSNFSDLSMLDLRRNNFHGIIPAAWRDDCKLRMISISYNQLQGKLVDFELRILILRSNHFYGVIDPKPKTKGFPSLRIIDLSGNNMWEAMKTIQANHMTYMGENIRPNFTDVDTYYGEYDYSMTMFNKGVKLEYDKIQDIFLAIDFSNNRFDGKIPEIIGNLKGLNLLNLSNNLLKGHIPPSLASLGSLEGLDLSKNKLSRKIPPELAQLTFLAFFNVSYNELEGPIPQGKQFDTFQSNQCEGNLGLCGAPLTKKYFGDSPPFFPTSDDESIALFKFNWIVILMGYACGLVIGVVAGNEVTKRKNAWFLKIFGRKK